MRATIIDEEWVTPLIEKAKCLKADVHTAHVVLHDTRIGAHSIQHSLSRNERLRMINLFPYRATGKSGLSIDIPAGR